MNFTRHIQNRLKENKRAFKLYKDFDRAEQIAEEVVKMGINTKEDRPMDYLIVYIPDHQAYACCFNQSQALATNKTGGYIGWIGDLGHFSF